MKAFDVMVADLITAKPDSKVQDVAAPLLTNRISAVPVVDDAGTLVGLISEGDLLRRGEAGTGHERLWWLKLPPNLVNATVTDGTVDLWGVVETSVEEQALRVAVEDMPGVKAVNDDVFVRPVASGTWFIEFHETDHIRGIHFFPEWLVASLV